MQRVTLRPGYEISRVVAGGWQLAGGHGAVDRAQAVENLVAYAEAGISAFDCADIYTGVEELYGDFRRAYAHRHGAGALANIKIHTKFVPDLDLLPVIDKAHVQKNIDRSLQRLGAERLDLVQFHWWDYAAPRMAETTLWLDDLRRDGKIDLIGGTNFDTAHTAALLRAGVPLASMQVQYSLLDGRPENGLAELCRANDVAVLCYGSVAGGFLSDAWLGRPEPAGPLENRSLTKYRLVIDEFGGWSLFQELLAALRAVADRHGTDIASVASCAMLDRPGVTGVILGVRSRAHLAENLAIADLTLTGEDHAAIDRVLARRRGPSGEPFELERDRTGPHGAIMKYNLGRVA